MAEYFRARRQRSTVWTARNPVLEKCELGFETDTYRVKVGDGSTSWTLLPYMDEGGSAVANPERLVYDTLLLDYPGVTPLSGRVFPGDANSKAPDIAAHYTRYSKCLWDIHEVGGSGIWNGLRFATVYDMYEYVSARAAPHLMDPTTYRYEIMATCYDVINQTVPAVVKLYGMNTFYSMLRGHRSYKLSTAAIDGDNVGWMNKAAWFSSVCAAGIGFPTPTGYTASRMRAIWMGRTSMNMYGLPYDGFTCASVTNSARYVYDSGTDTWVPVTPGHNHVHVTTPPLPGEFNKLWCSFKLNSGGATWEISESMEGVSRYGRSSEHSSICLYRMKDATTSAHRSVFIKPVGIDKVGLNYFDTATHELYAVYQSLDRTIKIKPVTPGMRQESSDLAWVDKMQWFPYNSGAPTRFGYHRTGMEAPSVRFMLRDRATNEISAPSDMCIRLHEGQRNAPVKWLVHRG